MLCARERECASMQVCMCVRVCTCVYVCVCVFVQAFASHVRAGLSSPRERPTMNASHVLSKHAQEHLERCI